VAFTGSGIGAIARAGVYVYRGAKAVRAVKTIQTIAFANKLPNQLDLCRNAPCISFDL